ncbi:hypothetical protein BDY21DRAFT_340512 [Lineolata rhizophorae]|uniref:Uncharacterized protein n=1 Tax=Lineolata rhizophorae TaxID=578093 RepID=A0A6A6P402_9PEZI|nr:hypothetical protein BDY21DRAFT_340512 [Lineolata rhizophorae]
MRAPATQPPGERRPAPDTCPARQPSPRGIPASSATPTYQERLGPIDPRSLPARLSRTCLRLAHTVPSLLPARCALQRRGGGGGVSAGRVMRTLLKLTRRRRRRRRRLRSRAILHTTYVVGTKHRLPTARKSQAKPQRIPTFLARRAGLRNTSTNAAGFDGKMDPGGGGRAELRRRGEGERLIARDSMPPSRKWATDCHSLPGAWELCRAKRAPLAYG